MISSMAGANYYVKGSDFNGRVDGPFDEITGKELQPFEVVQLNILTPGKQKRCKQN